MVSAFLLGAGKKQSQLLKIQKTGGIIKLRKSAISQLFMIMLQIILAIKSKRKRFSRLFSVKKAALHEHFYKKDDAIMKKRKRRLNPIYWVFQYLGGLVAIGSLFFIPYLIEKILGGC